MKYSHRTHLRALLRLADRLSAPQVEEFLREKHPKRLHELLQPPTKLLHSSSCRSHKKKKPMQLLLLSAPRFLSPVPPDPTQRIQGPLKLSTAPQLPCCLNPTRRKKKRTTPAARSTLRIPRMKLNTPPACSSQLQETQLLQLALEGAADRKHRAQQLLGTATTTQNRRAKRKTKGKRKTDQKGRIT